jgi:outer membrane protein assembly factor BamB
MATTTRIPLDGRVRRRRAGRLVASAVAASALVAVVAACGSSSSSSSSSTSGSATAGSWTYPNGDLANTRVADGSTISADNVDTLNQAWSHPLKGKSSMFGSFAAIPIVQDGVVYLQDLQSNVFALDLKTGALKWRHVVNRPDVGPNGVAVADGKVFAADPKSAFALDAATGKKVWSNDGLVGKNGIGFTIQPQVADGRVYISTATQPGGGVTRTPARACGASRR